MEQNNILKGGERIPYCQWLFSGTKKWDSGYQSPLSTEVGSRIYLCIQEYVFIAGSKTRKKTMKNSSENTGLLATFRNTLWDLRKSPEIWYQKVFGLRSFYVF